MSMGRRIIILSLLLLALGAMCRGAPARDLIGRDETAIGGLRQELERARRELRDMSEKRLALEDKVEADLVEVKKLKKELAAGGGFLKERKLEGLLKRSRDGIGELEALKSAEDVLRREMVKYAAGLMVMYNGVIDTALRSARFAEEEEAMPRLADWIIERQRCRQLYFELRAKRDTPVVDALALAEIDAAGGAGIGLARAILERQVETIDKELLRLEEELEDLRTEKSHWLRMRRLMHQMTRRRGDPIIDDGAMLDDFSEANAVLEGGRDVESMKAEMKSLGERRDHLKRERARAHKLLQRLGEKE